LGVDGQTVKQVLEAVFLKNPQARGYVLDDQGAVRSHMVVFVDGQQIHDRQNLTDPVGENGEIYVADGYGNSSVHRFSAEGQHLHSWGAPGDGRGEFTTPHGIWIDVQDRVLGLPVLGQGDPEQHRGQQQRQQRDGHHHHHQPFGPQRQISPGPARWLLVGSLQSIAHVTEMSEDDTPT